MLRAANRAGQSLIRQLDEYDDIETELDTLSDNYYDVVEKAKDKLKTAKETVKKAKRFVLVIEILEVWILEIVEIISRFETVGSDPETIKKQLKEIEDMQSGIAKNTVQIKVRYYRLIFTIYMSLERRLVWPTYSLRKHSLSLFSLGSNLCHARN